LPALMLAVFLPAPPSVGAASEPFRSMPCVVLARDEVDHAADRVGAVERRGAVLQHLDALDRGGRDVVQVDAGVVAGRSEVGQAAAVQQHQRGRGADAAQVGALRPRWPEVPSVMLAPSVIGAGVGADVLDQFSPRWWRPSSRCPRG
jgi:hypothetical protein